VGFRRRRWRDAKPDEDKVRVNRKIRVPEVRVVNEDGQQLGVMPTEAARDIAARIGLDLVEISPNASPPVCKIMDYGRYKYEAKKKAATARKTQHQSQVKEVKLRPQIDDHDRDFKLRNARRFLMEGDKVKFTVMFRGREIVHTQVGRDLLAQITEQLSEIAKPESRPQMEGRMLSVIVAPDRAAIEKIKAREKSRREAEAKRRAEAGEAPEVEEDLAEEHEEFEDDDFEDDDFEDEDGSEGDDASSDEEV
jgi:translation initiation factor IF-3